MDIAQRILESAKLKGLDAAEVIMSSSSELSVSRRMRKLESVEESTSGGLGIRVFKGKKVSSVATMDMSERSVSEAMDRVFSMVDYVPEDEFAGQAATELLCRKIIPLELEDGFIPSVEKLSMLAEEAEETALSQKGITNSKGAGAGYAKTNVQLYTSNGFSGSYSATSYSNSVTVLAEHNGAMERDYDYTTARFFSDMKPAKQVGLKAAELVLKKLGARKIKTAKMPVVFDTRESGSLLRQLASAINGAAVARKTSFLKDSMGKQIFKNGINVVDNPLMHRGLASRPFDGEGVNTRQLDIIQNGVLQSWLLDVRSANQLGLQTTGHAVRGFSGSPAPANTNFYMAAGNVSPEELIADIKNGVYITETFGMGINLVTGDYSQGAAGFYIENGTLTYPVSEITIAGNLSEMFLNLTPANDLKFEYGINCPTVMIESMTVAGE